ncbi:ABC transporter permease subunit [Sneathiella sp. P13V-1]|uniref:ABC transporter permease n=1 Tax=Sneathiella sp. P13V-1 TaxID=2697366 RepID=UPI00187B4A23|nr:sugar ABC transporter permease [Sneathiella sp. P13V-1]MBE7637267.1 ABC transporter permease subunit [Sneathiella sp. P13V-1]
MGLFPALAVLCILFFGALFYALSQSLGYAPQYGVSEFITFRFYGQLFVDPGFWKSLGLTFYYALIPTFIGLVISIVFAVLLSNKFRGRGFALIIYKIPMVVPYLVGVSLVLLLFSNGGLIARFLYLVDIIDRPSDFPRLLQTAGGYGVMLVYLWKQVPFMTIILSSHLLVLGREAEESAVMLGASKWQILWHVTIPRLIPAIVSSTLIVFAFNFGSFEVPYILGAGFPNTLTVEAWRLFDDPDYSIRPKAMAIATVVSVVSGTCLLLYLSLYRRYEKKRGRL